MEIGRKAVKRNLDDLIDFGYEIEYTEEIRKKKNPPTGESEEVALTTDYYLERELTDSELHLLIDSVMRSRFNPHTQGKELVNKLERLSNKYFRSQISHISVVSESAPQNRQLFLTISSTQARMLIMAPTHAIGSRALSSSVIPCAVFMSLMRLSRRSMAS